jgi:hypothetical protein
MNPVSIKPSILLLIILTAVAVGRFTVAEKIKIEKQIVTVETKTEDKKQDTKSELDREKHKKIVTTEITKPDGTKESTTTTTEDTSTKQDRESDTTTHDAEQLTQTVKETKTIERGQGRLSISALVGPSISFSSGVGPLNYGAHIQRNLIGPITVGIWGISSGIGGASIGLTF